MACTVAANAEFAIRDGDTVVFLRDSITAARIESLQHLAARPVPYHFVVQPTADSGQRSR